MGAFDILKRNKSNTDEFIRSWNENQMLRFKDQLLYHGGFQKYLFNTGILIDHGKGNCPAVNEDKITDYKQFYIKLDFYYHWLGRKQAVTKLESFGIKKELLKINFIRSQLRTIERLQDLSIKKDEKRL